MIDAVQICEILMLCIFGASWPFNIVKSVRSRTAKGKSVMFEILIVVGYCFGLLGKILNYAETGVLVYSTWFFIANILMVSTDVVLYFRNLKLDRAREAAAA